MPPKTGAAVGSTSDINTILPLLFAAHPETAPNYKKMSAMDEYGRTPSALEHKFRTWRQKGREIAAKYPDGAVGPPAAPAKRRTPKDSNGIGGGKQVSSGENEKEGESAACTPKNGKKRGAATKPVGESPTKKLKGTKKAAIPKGKKAAPAAVDSEEGAGAIVKAKESETVDDESELEEMVFE